jgi:hypothetical protein
VALVRRLAVNDGDAFVASVLNRQKCITAYAHRFATNRRNLPRHFLAPKDSLAQPAHFRGLLGVNSHYRLHA